MLGFIGLQTPLLVVILIRRYTARSVDGGIRNMINAMLQSMHSEECMNISYL